MTRPADAGVLASGAQDEAQRSVTTGDRHRAADLPHRCRKTCQV